MADELKITLSVRFGKSGTLVNETYTDSVTVSGTTFLHNRQQVGTTEEALLLGDAAAGGYCFMVNRDVTNYVEVRLPGTGAANDGIRLKAGECALFRLGSDATAPFIIANTAPVNVEYWLFGD